MGPGGFPALPRSPCPHVLFITSSWPARVPSGARGCTAPPRCGSGWPPGPRVGTVPGPNAPLELLALGTLAETPLAEREGRRSGGGRERAAIPPASQPHLAGAQARGGLAPGRAAPRADSPPATTTQSPPCLLRLQCEPFPASHPLLRSPRGGTWGGDRPEPHPEPSPAGHPHPSLLAGREGVAGRGQGKERWAGSPNPNFAPPPRPCPGFRPLPCRGGKTTGKNRPPQVSLTGKSHANTGQSSIFPATRSARSQITAEPGCTAGQPSPPFTP